ncbi:proteasomal ubiquitin receptor ADRM1 homolog isoform X2 [Frankliniella occidentalis]|uniref:Proteasomal ubiquitin receptor ADRM1 homolog n=1 Tax=Frankliniella occidentalis TaxID=133901 RepID=A0A6J1SUI6_FRAOC|nr:proteasomal ubiquitin receptor ADRM1 homolog isoform X2 [Frankliniella occidentalis]
MPGGGALFGNSSSRSQNKNLVEFKAGKMTMKGKMVHPDKRKGLLYVYQSEDSLMHFCWKDRQSGTIEDDLIIFPDDCEFKRVNQCTTGRVYVLKFKSSNKKFFFWVQEPKTEKDDDNCRKLNDVLNNPPTPGSNRSGGGTPDGDLQNLLSNMSQQQLVQLFGGVGQMGGLSSILSTMNAPRSSSSSSGNKNSSSSGSGSGSGSSSTPAAAAVAAAAEATGSTTTAATTGTSGSSVTTTPVSSRTSSSKPAASNMDLAAGLNTESIQPLLSNPAVVRELQQHLPSPIEDSGDPQERLRLTLTSPQFQQALSSFSDALQSGQIGHVINQFDVDGDAVSAANRGNMEDFVRALQRTSIGSPSTPSAGGSSGATDASPGEVTQPEKKKKMDDSKTPDKKKDDDDEGMSMD